MQILMERASKTLERDQSLMNHASGDIPPQDASLPAAGDADSFIAELMANTRPLYVFLATLIVSPEEVDDVYQQTCLALWKKRQLYEPGRSFYAWACGFARNEALRHLRSRRTSKLRLGEKAIEAIADEQLKDDPAHGDLRQSALADCLEALPIPQRALLQRCYAGDEPIRSVADELGISAAALTMRLQRIRHALVKCIERSFGKRTEAS